MPIFRRLPAPTATAERFHRTGLDDRSNRLRRVGASEPVGFPYRHCLRCASPGKAILLGSYDLPRPTGIYWTPSPIFLHAEVCAPFRADGEVAPIVLANALVSVRAYDRDDQCLQGLGWACPGGEACAPLRQALDDPRTVFVSIHTARPGCPLTQVERLPDAGRLYGMDGQQRP